MLQTCDVGKNHLKDIDARLQYTCGTEDYDNNQAHVDRQQCSFSDRGMLNFMKSIVRHVLTGWILSLQYNLKPTLP